MQEIWKDIVGYEGLYQISNFGNVKSLNYNHTHTSKLLVPKRHHSGYVMVTLCKNNIHKNKFIHILVANAFIENIENKPCVNHIDGDKHNNHVSNLEWVTHKQNTQHAIKTGLRKNLTPLKGLFGGSHPASKKILQFDINGNFIREWDCISVAANYYGLNSCTISNCCAFRKKSAKGYIWRYAEK